MRQIASFITLFFCFIRFGQQAKITESERIILTYDFGDSDPVPKPQNIYYPYFRFDGFTTNKTDKKWKTAVLENVYIQVTLFPEIGGKIWGAVILIKKITLS